LRTVGNRIVRAAIACSIASSAAVIAAQRGWTANPEVVRRTTEARPQFNFDEARVAPSSLPDLFGGKPIRTPAEWIARRAEILELFRANVYGRSPGKPDTLRFDMRDQDDRAMGGAATLKRVAIVSRRGGREHAFELILFLPNAVRGRAPVFLFLNNRSTADTDPSRTQKSPFWPAEDLVSRGYGIAAITNGELAPDDKDRFRDGVIGLFDRSEARPAADAWAALSAWGWGGSRAMDYFESDPRVDPRHVALVGHSRGGKAALWAGAQDERFALVVSNESGEGGAALSRRNFGETLARINEAFPHWFAGAYTPFGSRVDSLPLDQHMLLALIAPRALYVASADEDLWSDPRGEFLSLAASSPAYALYGARPIRPDEMPPLETPLVAGTRAYHIRRGMHDLTPYDWARYADFADRLWRK